MLSFVHIVLYMFNSKKKTKTWALLKIKNSEVIHVFMPSLLPGKQYSFFTLKLCWFIPIYLIFKNLYLFFITTQRYECSGNPLQYSCLENPMDGGAW